MSTAPQQRKSASKMADHPQWAKTFGRWLGGLAFVVAALASLITAMGKLDDAFSKNVADDIKQAMYLAGMIQFTPYTEIRGDTMTLDGGHGGPKGFARLAIPDNLNYRNVHVKQVDASCTYEVVEPNCISNADQHTTYCFSPGSIGACSPGNSHVTWYIAADVLERYDAVKLTRLGIVVFWVFVVIGLCLITAPTLIGIFRRTR
ncbi:hypothetical protein [Paraburkholderia sp. J8-2]|uniref:hypothetical protein n=1 Tax=Paraburkholderia sp. J8-2 TaxID=2805440 RepID=UPI002AB73298|nr:hypothetical protein [Paraburkholderia sp. J8-2]